MWHVLQGNGGGSDRFFDQPRTQAAGADANAFVAAVYDRAHGLDIGIEDPPGFVVGMAHIVPGGRFLLTEFTLKCHGSYSFSSKSILSERWMLPQTNKR